MVLTVRWTNPISAKTNDVSDVSADFASDALWAEFDSLELVLV